jgi:ABC-type cobalamin/Fe3+-siderophores transport system ATPase subunit
VSSEAAPKILDNLNMVAPRGSRTLLLGANGSGKSTFLRILAGRHLTPDDRNVSVCGLNAYRDTRLNFHRAYLDCDWGMKAGGFSGSAPRAADIAVRDMLKKLQAEYVARAKLARERSERKEGRPSAAGAGELRSERRRKASSSAAETGSLSERKEGVLLRRKRADPFGCCRGETPQTLLRPTQNLPSPLPPLRSRRYPERRDEIVEMLGIDLDWRMHELSDGQRRRVQILLGLVRPFEILLLDEITTSLDVCVRQDLLRWLQKETVERGATIV